jgi:acyl carrier protein
MIETMTTSPETSAPTFSSPSVLLEVATLVVTAVNLHHIDPATLTESTSLRETGLDLDSVDMLEVIVAVEQKYGVKVADAETGKKYFRTLGGIAEFVKANRTSV